MPVPILVSDIFLSDLMIIHLLKGTECNKSLDLLKFIYFYWCTKAWMLDTVLQGKFTIIWSVIPLQLSLYLCFLRDTVFRSQLCFLVYCAKCSSESLSVSSTCQFSLCYLKPSLVSYSLKCRASKGKIETLPFSCLFAFINFTHW